MKRALRLILIWLALAAGPPSSSSAWFAVVTGMTVTPAGAQTSGGYSRPGGGSFSGFARRPAIGTGLGMPSVSAFGALGGADLAISRRAAGEALRNYRAAPAQPPALATRRPSSGWDDGSWGTAPLPRRLPP